MSDEETGLKVSCTAPLELRRLRSQGRRSTSPSVEAQLDLRQKSARAKLLATTSFSPRSVFRSEAPAGCFPPRVQSRSAATFTRLTPKVTTAERRPRG